MCNSEILRGTMWGYVEGLSLKQTTVDYKNKVHCVYKFLYWYTIVTVCAHLRLWVKLNVLI